MLSVCLSHPVSLSLRMLRCINICLLAVSLSLVVSSLRSLFFCNCWLTLLPTLLNEEVQSWTQVSRGSTLLSYSLVCSDHGGLLFGPGGLARGGSRPFGTGRRLGLLCLRRLLPRQRLQKLSSCRLEVKSCRLHPGVCADLVDLGSQIAIVAEKLEDEVLELPAEPRAVDFLEVSVMLALQEQVVEVFLLASLLEWEDALHDNEEDDANGEHVDILSLVCLALLDLWCHVGHGAAVAVE